MTLSFLIERSLHAGLALGGGVLVVAARVRGRLGAGAFLAAALVITAADLVGVNWPAGVTLARPDRGL